MKIIVLPYRDAYFWNEYGTAVRDLQIIALLAKSHDVTVINRPVSVYERLLNKPKKNSTYDLEGVDISFVDSTSFDLLSPLKGRRWTRTCYAKLVKSVMEKMDKEEEPYILLDFTPFAKVEIKAEYVIYWYDLIDNFTKHNRFSKEERSLVHEKYSEVSLNASFITGVSAMAISEIDHMDKYVIPNGVYVESVVSGAQDLLHLNQNYEFDFAFVGFITDKLDLEFVNKLADKYKVAIFGQFFDSGVKSRLNKNIFLGGKFKYSDISTIMDRFSVGLLPYRENLTHDESPLKLYEYFKHGKPCLASLDYEVASKYYLNYNSCDEVQLKDIISRFFEISGSDTVKKEIDSSWFLENRISEFLRDKVNVR